MPPPDVSGDSTLVRLGVGSGFGGDESVLVSNVYKAEMFNQPAERTIFTALIRVGDAVVLLEVTGWEFSSAKRADVDRLVQSALTRATA